MYANYCMCMCISVCLLIIMQTKSNEPEQTGLCAVQDAGIDRYQEALLHPSCI